MTNEDITTRAQYVALFATRSEAIEYEDQCLSIGDEFLPACARVVRDNRNPSIEPPPTYWQWLASQVTS